MARTRNSIISRYHRLKAIALRQRPSDLAVRLRSNMEAAHATRAVSPASAWEVYTRSPSIKCFADNGWLVQFGVYEGTEGAAFHFSLVRQTDTLEHWNDEYMQIELLLLHPPTPELLSLKRWERWSFEYPALPEFFASCASHQPFAQVLAHRGTDWTWQVHAHET